MQPQTFYRAVADDFSAVDEIIKKQLTSRVPLVSKIGDYITSAGGKRLRPLRLVRLLLLLPARRVAALVAELVRRLAAAEATADCPAIVFSSQWGLPVLSHSASCRSSRLRALYLDRNLSAGTGSPC